MRKGNEQICRAVVELKMTEQEVRGRYKSISREPSQKAYE